MSGAPRARVMVAVPTYTCEVHYRLLESLTAAWVYCLMHGIELELRVAARFSLVQYARNYLVQQFLADESYTHLMWIDADVGFDPRAIMQLLNHEKDVIGGVYPVKTTPATFPYEPEGEWSADLHKAKVLPGGFLLCSRHAIETVAKSVPWYLLTHAGQENMTPHVFDLVLENERLLGEDIIFCRRMRDLGFDVWVDPDINFTHSGMMDWAANLATSVRRQNEAQKGSAVLASAVKAELTRSSAA